MMIMMMTEKKESQEIKYEFVNGTRSECIGEANVVDSGDISCCLSATVGMFRAVL